MHSNRNQVSNTRRAAVGICLALGFLGSTANLSAQIKDRDSADPTGFIAIRRPPVTFDKLHAADYRRSLSLVQVRRSRDQGAMQPGVLETLTVLAQSPGSEPRFALHFAGIEGRELSNAEMERRTDLFQRHAGFLYRYGSFRVEDPVRAANNYEIVTLHDGPGQRLGRGTDRVLIRPKNPGPSSWILDVDRETGYPLYRAELGPGGQTLAELEVTNFGFAAPNRMDQTTFWQSPRQTFQFGDVESARESFPQAPSLELDSVTCPEGHTLQSVRISEDPLSSELSVVHGFSDGIDDMFVVCLAGTPRPVTFPSLADVPSSQPKAFVLQMQEGNVSQFHFWHDQVLYQVIGKRGQAELHPFAMDLYRSVLGIR